MPRLVATLRTAALAAAALSLHGPASAGGVDVGVSVQISRPGVWGRVDIGRFPQPAVVLPQPVIVLPPPQPAGVAIAAPPPPQPVYMWVPPGQRMNWHRYCARYGACGVPVYFVRHDWYARHVQPREHWEDQRRGHWRERDGDRRHQRSDDHGRRRGRDRD